MPDSTPPNSDDRELVPADDSVIGRAFRRSLAGFLVITLAAALLVWWQSREPAPAPVREATGPAAPVAPHSAEITPPAIPFTDITREAGIDFVHVNGAYGDRLLPETMGGGVAFLDFDDDGDPDLLFVNSNYWPWHPAADGGLPTMALYRNDGGRFTNVTRGSGLDISAYGMGAAVGDYDGDGRIDVFITAVGGNHLFHNLGGGRFEDVTGNAGVAGAESEWSTSAAFFDYDGDGDLDLFVANYVQWSRDIDLEIDFRLTGLGRAYGPPTNFRGTQPYLYRNDGNGRFTDVSETAGMHVYNPATGDPMSKGLAVMPVDLDGDQRLDLFMANDTVRNFVYRNLGDGRFEEIGDRAGLAFDRNGAATGAMGVDVANFRNDDDLALAIGNFSNEMSSFYVSQGTPGQFADEAIATGIGPPSRLALTFGLFFFDADLDGRSDLLAANGHVEDEINKVQASQHYEQPVQLFWNCGDRCRTPFVEAPAELVGDLARPVVGRGTAYADIDGDGDLDVVVTQVGRRPVLLRNDQALGHHWLRVRLRDSGGNRYAVGAQVAIESGGVVQRREVMPARGYLSQMELPVTFGLGDAGRVDELWVRWPDGKLQRMSDVAVDRELLVERQDLPQP